MPSMRRRSPARPIVRLLRALLHLPLSLLRVFFIGMALGLAPPPPGVKQLRHDDDVVQIEESRQRDDAGMTP